MGGDFNFVENTKLDKIGGNPNKGTEGLFQSNNIKQAYNLIDPYRSLNKYDCSYTWSNNTIGVKTRLDRFYINKNFLENVIETLNSNFNVSDHVGVILKLSEKDKNNFHTGKGVWKFNNSLLNDHNFNSEIENFCTTKIGDNNVKNWTWWEDVKIKFKEIAIKHSVKKVKDKRQQLRDLEDGIKQLDALELSANDDLKTTITCEKNLLKNKIDTIYRENFLGACIRSKCESLKNNENPSSKFLRIEVLNNKKMLLKGVKNENGELSTNSDQTLTNCELYYKNLYNFEENNNELSDCFTTDLPQIPSDIKNYCEGNIHTEEMKISLYSMKNGKSPGSDGLTNDFYKKFWHLMGEIFTYIVNSMMNNENELCPTMRLGMIRLFKKSSKDPKDLKNYRPITLLNTDYKIIAKVLANRLKTALPNIINEDQSFGIKGRSIQNNQIFLKATFDYISQKNLPGIFLNIDQEKAFDKVSHNYLFKVIEKFGFGTNFCRWITILYNKMESKILVNGYMSKKIDILRSVRQGCPIAPLLYICVIETLLIRIRNSPDIHGIKSPTSNRELLTSAFADDSGFFLDGTKSAKNVLKEFDNFGQASGSKVNKDKTEGMWLGEHRHRTDKPIDINWVKKTKSLGMYFGYDNINNMNWLPCLDSFRHDLMKHIDRDTTLIGKVIILNSIGYSRLWFKSIFTKIPDRNCSREDGSLVNIPDKLKKLTQGFLWGFNLKNDNFTLDLDRPKTVGISKETMYLPKSKGGANLIDFHAKMKTFRILLIFKYLSSSINHKWSEILEYWLAVNLNQITHRGWSNNYPHNQFISNIPLFFRICLVEFKDYCQKFGYTENEQLSSKKIYLNLINSRNHRPASISRFPENEFFFGQLYFKKILDPYLREFLFRLYHCKLNFKRYRLNINDLLNFGQKCTLCKISIDTPQHLFEVCQMGNLLRNLCILLLSKIGCNYHTLTQDQKIYCFFENTDDISKLSQYILCAANYSIYKIKLKKIFDTTFSPTSEMAVIFFIKRIKWRILCDHRYLSYEKFKQTWDAEENNALFVHARSDILHWHF